MLLLILVVLCVTSAVFNLIGTNFANEKYWYIGEVKQMGLMSFFFNILTFMILFNNLIPISLTVTLELVRFAQAIFINLDIDMYHAESNTPAMARTSNLNEELGMVNYIFSDKTGTLTRNVMEFKKCSIAGQVYSLDDHTEENGGMSEKASTSFTTTDGPAPSRLGQTIKSGSPNSEIAREFMTLMGICHTVIPENTSSGHDEIDGIAQNSERAEDIVYHAASPDERALVEGAKMFGFVFHTRTPAYVELNALGDTER
jgi:phospholipid-transporting ATPase